MIPTFLFLRVRFLDDDCLCYGSIPLYSLKFFLVKYFAAIGLLVALIELTLLFPLSIYLSQI